MGSLLVAAPLRGRRGSQPGSRAARTSAGPWRRPSGGVEDRNDDLDLDPRRPVDGWRRPSGGVEDRNQAVRVVMLGAWLSGGAPPGASRIATGSRDERGPSALGGGAPPGASRIATSDQPSSSQAPSRGGAPPGASRIATVRRRWSRGAAPGGGAPPGASRIATRQS